VFLALVYLVFKVKEPICLEEESSTSFSELLKLSYSSAGIEVNLCQEANTWIEIFDSVASYPFHHVLDHIRSRAVGLHLFETNV